jgi:hypothetical protein
MGDWTWGYTAVLVLGWAGGIVTAGVVLAWLERGKRR